MEMKIGELEISAALNRAGTPYSAQEDIRLEFTLENKATVQSLAPMVGSIAATLTMKDPSGKEKILKWTPPHTPGTPRFTDEPEANLEPGQIWSPSLPLQDYFGFFGKGKYSVKFKLESAKYPIATDWMDFEVNGLQVGSSSAVPSTQGEARYMHHAWLDLGSDPARIVFRRPFIGKERPLPHRTHVVGEGGAASEPHASMAPFGAEPATAFVGWLQGDSLKLARVKGNDSVSNHALKLPFKADSAWGPLLAYSEKPGNPGQLSGMVLSSDASHRALHLFRMAASAQPAWLPPLPLPKGEILAIRMLPVTSALRVALMVRRASDSLQVECLAWEDGKTPGAPLAIASLTPGNSIFQGLGAALSDGILKWSIALLEPAQKGKDRKLMLYSHGFNLAQGRTTPGAPKASTYSTQPGPVQASVELDSQGTPWLLQRDVHGAWVQSPEWMDPIAVDTPRGSLRESLLFRRGSLPRVMLLDPDSGFQIKAVDFPAGEVLDQDDEDNR